MAVTLPDPGTEFGARVARRLHDEPLAWLTVVDGAGTPQPAPVWFLWDDASNSALIYSQGGAKRLEHLRANPRVAFHFDGDGQGGDIVVLTGTAEVAPDEPSADRNPAYLAKYGERIIGGWQTPENFASIYSVPLRFRPSRVRGH
ncbi:TIGR03667 family PPOX class F420-dependent oxidoreductase [Pseudonocardia acidicola]|uniref:TIGR03667 family PPOX class F420-dependent oxidoreductase n=1 Tax=Pseudonocardia acidicola TaxID=2724939 RepID=A0ABX1S403_9PSEU|nr:TIGR03667 family PPOX class F420-dependent oxidoreductase [Pseudonocardia acidicola]NMH96295.1 TIGR03667 family PPOX class F420-dependent oxidoreductase [Pseudonocardia acidicola]